jgi:phosphoglycolate phosphatase
MFRLSQLLSCDDIVIQCHNIPDADSLASAFAVYTYLRENGKDARIIYSGHLEITKVNLLEMIVNLSIPVEYVQNMPPVKTLVTVDCQYGEKNAEKFAADTVVVIDHHVDVGSDRTTGVIHSQLGSCATLVWDLLCEEGFDFKKHPNVSTALYYGLYTDTNNLEEIAHPLDKDARDSLKFNKSIIKSLRNNNLSLSELNIAGTALTQHRTNQDSGYSIFRANPCDPNILGFISDLALQVSGIDICIVYNELQDGYKLSVRSCKREVMANQFTQFLTEGIGSGGGHIQKAGGFILKSKIEAMGTDIEAFMEKRLLDYFSSYDVIDSSKHNLDLCNMAQYRKRKIPIGFAPSTDIFKEGTPILIRTLEGDSEAEAGEDVVLMIGILGEVYPIKAGNFKRSYAVTGQPFITDFTYSPTVKNKLTGDSVEIIKYAKPCIAEGEVCVYAMPVVKNTKVFTAWNPEGYMHGKPGDFLAVRFNDHNDVYIIRKDIFDKTYMKI